MTPSPLFRPWDGCATPTVTARPAVPSSPESDSLPASPSSAPASPASVTQPASPSSLPASPGSLPASPASPVGLPLSPVGLTAAPLGWPLCGAPPGTDLSQLLWPSALAAGADPWSAALAEEGRRRVDASRRRLKKFGCPKCPMMFSNRGQLAGHYRKHTGERPFECEACHKRFTRNEELTRHTRIHTGDRPFGCELCGKRFGRKDHLNKHQRTHAAPMYAAAAGLPAALLGLSPFELSTYLHSGMFGAPAF